MADILLNLLIFAITPILLIYIGRTEGKEKLIPAFRFFTCLSNILCSLTALVTAVSLAAGDLPEWVRILKYIGTAAVTVTMLTVFFFLAPSIGKDWVSKLLKGSDFFMHLLTPLAALVSFCVLEKKAMSFPQSLWGLLPVVLYGPLYLYKILYAPEEKRWKDFYGFNKQGKWPVAFSAMLAGTFLICMALMALQNATLP